MPKPLVSFLFPLLFANLRPVQRTLRRRRPDLTTECQREWKNRQTELWQIRQGRVQDFKPQRTQPPSGSRLIARMKEIETQQLRQLLEVFGLSKGDIDGHLEYGLAIETRRKAMAPSECGTNGTGFAHPDPLHSSSLSPTTEQIPSINSTRLSVLPSRPLHPGYNQERPQLTGSTSQPGSSSHRSDHGSHPLERMARKPTTNEGFRTEADRDCQTEF